MTTTAESRAPHCAADRRLAVLMFAASLVFLTCLSMVLHLDDNQFSRPVVTASLWTMLALHPLFALEAALYLLLGQVRWKRDLGCWILPPLRLAARDHATGERFWLPFHGWMKADSRTRETVAAAFHYPMLATALMVVPLLAAEFIWKDAIEASPRLTFLSQLAASVIWIAFAAEFIVMISIVENRVRYCREHWIDLAIIILPLIAFMRAARLGRLMRFQGLAKSARMFRLRGMLMRVYRALLMFEVIERLINRNPSKRIAKLQASVAEKEREIDLLRAEIHKLEQSVAQPIQRRKAA
jgi:voltage-gated potassium channel